MKKIVCEIISSPDHVIKFIEESMFGFDETRVKFKATREKEAYLIIELVNKIPALSWFEAAEKWLREKRYFKGKHAFKIVGVTTYGIAIYDDAHLARKDVSVFIPWSNIAGIHTHTDEDLVEMENEVKRLPYLHREGGK
ncbi:hypothetical protein [Desulforamulus ruminis]|uniref:Uncharacterized protein n=1 Tax=Desulforamulus ruminis (strain ATCC 23193 / DSM 2154 / NCIMB 8452 / DL) TaxID=696281 RepID=F6DTV4_DESRL|nr:hypothetical protein [Desulforamulus ruminis]AEG58972.1 hypothetical protein Desru_0687 [Desulforamulus ruminis DSM 2154]